MALVARHLVESMGCGVLVLASRRGLGAPGAGELVGASWRGWVRG